MIVAFPLPLEVNRVYDIPGSCIKKIRERKDIEKYYGPFLVIRQATRDEFIEYCTEVLGPVKMDTKFDALHPYYYEIHID